MSTSHHIDLPLDFNQLFELVKQLPDKEKQQLIALLKQEQEEDISIPEEHKKLVRRRIKHYKQHPEELVDRETAKPESAKKLSLSDGKKLAHKLIDTWAKGKALD